MNGVIDQ